MPFAFPEDCLGDFRIAGASSGAPRIIGCHQAE